MAHRILLASLIAASASANFGITFKSTYDFPVAVEWVGRDGDYVRMGMIEPLGQMSLSSVGEVMDRRQHDQKITRVRAW